MNNINIYQFYEDNYVSLQDYKKLQSNWNSLKAVIMVFIEETKKSLEFCKIHHLKDENYKRDLNLFQMILDKMNELERGDNNGYRNNGII